MALNPQVSGMDDVAEAMNMAEVKGRSLWADARVRFFRNKAAVASLIVLALIAAFALFGGFFAQYERDFVDFALIGSNAQNGVPSIETGHYFGTDANGRDLFARTVQGTRISLLVGIVGAMVESDVDLYWLRASDPVLDRAQSLPRARLAGAGVASRPDARALALEHQP